MDIDTRDRTALISSFPPNATVAEIGVQSGGFTGIILRQCKPKILYAIDCWEHQSIAAYGHDPANVSGEQHEKHYQYMLRCSKHYPNLKIIRAYSLIAVEGFADESLDWMYFDANHLQLRADLEAWWPKVKKGGWAAGHDYCVHDDFILVEPVVNHFVSEHGLSLYVTEEAEFPSWAFQKTEKQ